MHTSQSGVDLIKEYEGLRLESYYCPAGILTIGYGHTGSDVWVGMIISEPEAEKTSQKKILLNLKTQLKNILILNLIKINLML